MTTQDWLSRLLELMPVRGALDIRCLYGAPWRIDEPDRSGGEIRYHAVMAGIALLENPKGGAPRRLDVGDILIMPHGHAHTLHDGSGLRAVPAHNRASANVLFSESKARGKARSKPDGTRGGAVLDMLCGRFMLTPPHDRVLRDYLPPVLIVRAAETPTGARLGNLLALMRAETDAQTLGGQAMLNALSAALFALALRHASETNAAPKGLLALAGHPRLAPALGAMFEDPARAWTLPALAKLCHVSRATLARLFQDSLGRSASDLLADIRMTVAANALRVPGTSTGAAAEAAGYQSDAAFQRAFKQHMGLTPAQWRRR